MAAVDGRRRQHRRPGRKLRNPGETGKQGSVLLFLYMILYTFSIACCKTILAGIGVYSSAFGLFPLLWKKVFLIPHKNDSYTYMSCVYRPNPVLSTLQNLTFS